jgi:hypothetical protein
MSAAVTAALTELVRVAQENPHLQPLPAEPPIGGPIWTVVVPAALLVVAIWGTWLLYRHFAKED